jgi:hypothetical protein
VEICCYFRICKTRRKQLDNPQKNTLDGDLLWRYFDLSFIERNELLSRLGMQSDQVRIKQKKKNLFLIYSFYF